MLAGILNVVEFMCVMTVDFIYYPSTQSSLSSCFMNLNFKNCQKQLVLTQAGIILLSGQQQRTAASTICGQGL